MRQWLVAEYQAAWKAERRGTLKNPNWFLTEKQGNQCNNITTLRNISAECPHLLSCPVCLFNRS
jgi:hypothetical protein